MQRQTTSDRALVVLNVGALYLWPEDKRPCWLCRVCAMFRVICFAFCFVHWLYMLMSDSCCCPIILLAQFYDSV